MMVGLDSVPDTPVLGSLAAILWTRWKAASLKLDPQFMSLPPKVGFESTPHLPRVLQCQFYIVAWKVEPCLSIR